MSSTQLPYYFYHKVSSTKVVAIFPQQTKAHRPNLAKKNFENKVSFMAALMLQEQS